MQVVMHGGERQAHTTSRSPDLNLLPRNYLQPSAALGILLCKLVCYADGGWWVSACITKWRLQTPADVLWLPNARQIVVRSMIGAQIDRNPCSRVAILILGRREGER
jgi:hypothetical protein